MKLYTVTFTFNDDYKPKVECFRRMSLVVSAENQFKALQVAWDRLTVLGTLPEPKEFSAERVSE
jgi:hypothetical protein